jgi:S-DNA-T family DNA segregation ATPase FtsK/SpoIIIE
MLGQRLTSRERKPSKIDFSLRVFRGRELIIGGLLLLGLALALLGLVLWPIFHFAMPPIMIWTIGFLVLLRKHPRRLLRWRQIWLGSLLLVFPTAGLLELYQENWGGTVGSGLTGASDLMGAARILGLSLTIMSIMFPIRSWKILSKAGTFAWLVLRVTTPQLVTGSLKFLSLITTVLTTALKTIRGLFTDSRLSSSMQTVLKHRVRTSGDSGNLVNVGSDFITEPNTVDFDIHTQSSLPTDSELAIPQLEELEQESELHIEERTSDILPSDGGWKLPSIDLLERAKEAWVSQTENEERGHLIEQTLSDYGIEVTVGEIRPGPVVTQFGVVPGWTRKYRDVQDRDIEGNPVRDSSGRLAKKRVEEKIRVKVDSILSREKDLALALAARSIRFEAPVPGESFVGLEVPNSSPSVVSLRALLESPLFFSVRSKGALPIALGKGSGGDPVVADLSEMPHMLIAGATGSGKSVCINAIITSLLFQFSPLELRLLLIDPKRVELTPYQGLPHLLAPVLVESEDALPALRNLILEMQSRYKKFEQRRARNIRTYNDQLTEASSRLPYIVVIIDELADLMMSVPVEVEQSLCRLAQLGRATGIHLVLATQRPSVDVLTGLIKANVPSRISFAVSSQVDSRTILDGSGAEKLLGRGDMLFLPTEALKPKRLQGAYVSDGDVNRLTSHWRRHRGLIPELTMAQPEETVPSSSRSDTLFIQAQELLPSHRRISAPLLQRKLGIGFTKASDILEKLEQMGYIGSGDPGKSREVLIGKASRIELGME